MGISRKHKSKHPLKVAAAPVAKPSNPFQERWDRSKANAARKQLRASQSRNNVIDKRIAEHDPNVTEADRYLIRLQRERTKSNRKSARYNLNDYIADDALNLVKFGKEDGTEEDGGPGDVKGFTEDRYEDDDDEEQDNDNEELFTLKKKKAKSGTGEEEGERAEEDDEEEFVKTKQEVMSEVIQKSKHYKAQRQQDKHQADEQTARLDTGLQQIMELVRESHADKQQQQQHEKSQKLSSILPQDPAAKEVTGEKKSSGFEYDSVYQILAAEKRSRPTSRLLTEEEAAEKERDELIEMENLRKMRMHELEEVADTKGGKKKGRKHAGADDLVDSFQDTISDDDSDRGMLGGNEDNHEDEDMLEDTDGQSAERDDDEAPKSSAVGSSDSFWNTFEVDEIVGTEQENETEVPFVFKKCPKTAIDLQLLFKASNLQQRDLIIERLRKCFAVSLDSGRNKLRLQNLLECLLFRIERLCEIGRGDLLEFSTKEIDLLSKHVHILGPTYKSIVSSWARRKITECIAALSTQPEAAKAPTGNSDVMESEEIEEVVIKNKKIVFGLSQVWSSKHVLILRCIGRLFPSSDLRHSVNTPLNILLSESVRTERMVTMADIALGVFVAYILMESTGGRHGYSSELATFLQSTLSHTYASKEGEPSGDLRLQSIFCGVEISSENESQVAPLKLSDCAPLPDADESTLRSVAAKILRCIILLLETIATNWVPHLDIVLANLNVHRIEASSVQDRVLDIVRQHQVQHGALNRKPLTLYTAANDRKVVKKVLNPRMHCEDNGVFHKRGRSRFNGPASVEEAAAAAKRVKRALRKAERGQARDIRTDAAAAAAEQMQQEHARRERVDKRDKEVRAFFEHQRSTWREAEKKQNLLTKKKW